MQHWCSVLDLSMTRTSPEYGPRGLPRQRHADIVRHDEVELGGQVYSPSCAPAVCMQKAGSPLQMANGWLIWKTGDGTVLSNKYEEYMPNHGETGEG
jgi:hypothetical protein